MSNRDARCVGRDCPEYERATECQSDLECEQTQTCESGTCVTYGAEACESSNDCAFGMHCDLRANSCVQCLLDDHCEVGLVCQADGSCGDGTVECGGDYDCPRGYQCDDGACVSGGTSGGGGGQEIPCGTQEDCDVYGRVCDAGVCIPCSSDAQCKAGYVCSAGACTDPNAGGGGGGGLPGFPGGGGTCASAYDCPVGQGCLMGMMCGLCLLDTDCRDGERCDPSSFQCVSGGGGDGGAAGGPGGGCTNAYDCPEGQGCMFGICGMCLVDTDCREAETCNASSFQCLG